MTKKHATIPAGTIVTMTTGAYSDYSIIGAFRAIKDITHEDIEEVEKEIQDQPKYNNMYEYDRYTAFIAILVVRGFIEDIPSAEIYLGHYGDIEPRVSFVGDDE